jgi:acid phosphatase family membrane protein YuiD
MIQEMLVNKVLIAVAAAAIISQGIKIIMNMRKDNRGISLADIIVTGGMPSTHCALVSSLFAILLLTSGLTEITIISFVIFVIVITDSMGVRRTAGEEGKLINKIIKLEKLNIKQMHYSIGHTPTQVLVGISIGIFVAIIVNFLI